jgi:hypothetical protein
MKYQVRLTKKSFYGGSESSIQGNIEAVTDQGARKEVWGLALRTELRLSGSLIRKIEVLINGVWEEIKNDPEKSEKVSLTNADKETKERK